MTAIGLILGLILPEAKAQNPYPGWAAPKRIPTRSERATYPDIAVDGDTIHVIFRATYTFVADDQGVPPEELILDEIQMLQLVERRNIDVQVEALGGKDAIRKRRQDLLKQLEQIQSRPDQTSNQSTSPVQTAIYYTRSDDRGKTFMETPVPIIAEPETFYGQCALHVDARGLYVGYTAEAGDNVIHTYATFSEDGGKNWSRPQQLSTSKFNCFDPHLAPIPGGGVIMTWWELEETETESKTSPGFEGMQEALDQGLIKTTERSRERSLIKYSRRLGGTWQTEKFLSDTDSVASYVNLTTGPNNEIFVHWVDRYGPECRVSRDGGVTWETTLDFSQVLDDQKSNTFLYGGGDYHFIQGDIELRRSTQLQHRKGLLQGDWQNVIDPQAQYSFPQLDFTKNEVQVVWGTTDNLAGQSVLYFREDNKPPTSELIYPVDGAFTKPVLVFLWDAVDDIATRMTYRWTIMKREKPDDQPEPHNWFEYEAAKENPIEPLPDGYYTLFLQAKDFAGNEEPKPTEFKFQTYYVPPKIEADRNSLPPVEIETRNMEIRWTTEDNTPTENDPLIAYRLDGNPVTEFARRDSIRISGLRQGWHQIQLYAKDENGNIYPFGDTVSVRVNLSLMLVWQEKPQQPVQDGEIFVSGDRVSLRWRVTDNTQDEGVNFFSSVRYIFNDGETSDWSTPQIFTDYEFSGEDGQPLREGKYIFQVIAQDEFGNQVFGSREQGDMGGAYIATQFTVDRTPPAVDFAEAVTYNEETKVPTLTVTGNDNYTQNQNLKYQFRVITRDEPDPPWSALGSSASFTAEGHPVKWYSWGYKVQARAQDIVGNVTTDVAEMNLIWYVRSPALLYTLVGVVALVALAILYLLFASMAEKRRQKKRQQAKREAAQKSSTTGALGGAEMAGAGTAAGDEDDLFEVRETSTSETGGSDDIFGSPAAAPPPSDFGGGGGSTFDDPFSTSETTVFDDPFAEAPPMEESKPERPAPPIDEDEPLEIGGGGSKEEPPPLEIGEEEKGHGDETIPEITPPPAEEPPASEPKKPGWSADKKVDLDDKDLFDPLS
ncbi:MAG: hypothetical protein KC917_05705 [Candidatus Omnitrophica bacterium]|nr:hypothetical protein [Candidatus Omnitrophota bacterium]